MNKVRVYLSGGFHSDWQKKVIKACGTDDFYFLNPLEKEVDLKSGEYEKKYISEETKEEMSQWQRQSPWWQQDRLAIEKADVVFAYWEDYRPKLLGTGVAFELGISYALGKVVILVNKIEHRYYREFEHLFISFKTLEEGIEHLRKMSWLK